MDKGSLQFIQLKEDTNLLPFDCGDEDLNNFLFEDAKRYLEDLMAVTYLFVDSAQQKTVAYFSGATRDGAMLASAKGVAIKVKKGPPLGNTVVLTAAQGNETAGFYEEQGHGLFTYFLLKKLQETKGDITLEQLSNYITTEVKRRSAVQGKIQTPSITPSSSLANNWQSWKLK